MKLVVEGSELRGRVWIPGSKSHTIRSVALAALAEGDSEVLSPLVSADTLSAASSYQALGAQVDTADPRRWLVTGVGGEVAAPADVVDVGNSGTSLRFALGSGALLGEGMAVFTGDEQIRSRPCGPLVRSLNDLGARCWSTRGNGRAPLVVEGRLRGGKTTMEAVSSQYLSSLLINAPLAGGDSEIVLTKLNERPYVEMTLGYLDSQGVEYENDGWRRFLLRGGQGYSGFSRRVPGDWSSAAFFLVAGAVLDGDVEIMGLDVNDVQGDKAVVEMLRAMGAWVEVVDGVVLVRRSELRGVELDLNATPDALPALAVAGCFASGETRLVNVPQARLKETDRIAVMAAELKKMGAELEELEDGLVVRGGRGLQGAQVNGHGDHRVVMALSVAGMGATGRTVIDTAEAVRVTFPEYVSLMRGLGGRLEAWAEADGSK